MQAPPCAHWAGGPPASSQRRLGPALWGKEASILHRMSQLSTAPLAPPCRRTNQGLQPILAGAGSTGNVRLPPPQAAAGSAAGMPAAEKNDAAEYFQLWAGLGEWCCHGGRQGSALQDTGSSTHLYCSCSLLVCVWRFRVQQHAASSCTNEP